ncbi:hypothetical protein IFR04_014503 [Cadophora malorum]|uniref:Uncharacterized protein n=1 Tax=Cadophora malorum TaxID=108018 RepID=A0A8H7T3L2_9HELO|nr:hypothetical protein IFR04_014503 [Cadophora malorum]
MCPSNLEARLSQGIAKAEERLGWKLGVSHEYNGMHTSAKCVTIGPLIPPPTDKELQAWKHCLREHGFSEEDIDKTGYGKVASVYVKLDSRR